MCGIVGYIGSADATPVILDGLKKLEYRGYDSAGIAVIQDQKIVVRRDAGKLSHLAELIQNDPIYGPIGIGHTRWATHGEPNARNAHPHLGASGNIVVVHNGIVENHLELREELSAEGTVFNSETDTETIVHLIERLYTPNRGLLSATEEALTRIQGAHAVVVMSSYEPDKIIAARIGNAGGVVIGYGINEMYVASDIPAILERTRRVTFLESRQIAAISSNGVLLKAIQGGFSEPQIHIVSWDPVSAEKGEYRHFMQKEIHEQVRSINDTLAGRVDFDDGKIRIPQLNLSPEKAKKIRKIVITGCGTAAHAGLVGKIMIERIARLPVSVEIASKRAAWCWRSANRERQQIL